MAKLTYEQAERIKHVIDRSATIAEQYLEVAGINDGEFFASYPDYSGHSFDDYDAWLDQRARAWYDYVIANLRVENVIASCAVGGLVLEVAGKSDDPPNILWRVYRDNGHRIDVLDSEIIKLLNEEFGLTLIMLRQMQRVNDAVIANVALRRERLKAIVDIFTVFDDGEYAEIQNHSN